MKAALRNLLNLPGETIGAAVVCRGHLEWSILSRGKEGLKPVGSGRFDLPTPPEAGGASDETGSGAPEHMAQLQGEIRKTGLTGNVASGLPSEQLLLRVVSLPDVPDDELRSMVQLQVDKFSPFPVETTVVSHEVIEKKDGKSLVLIAAVEEGVVQAMGTLLGTVGLVPDRMDAAILGWWQVLHDAGQVQEKGRQVVLLLDALLPEVIVFQDGKPVLFRSLGESEGLEGEDFDVETARAVSYTLMSVEMEHGNDAYTIGVWHRGEARPGLIEKLQSECSCEAVLSSLDTLPSVSEGLARRAAAGDGRLNLVPAAWLARAESSLFKTRMVAVAMAAGGVWALIALAFVGGFLFQQHRLRSLEAEQARWRTQAREVTDMRRRVLTVEHYMDTSHSALECLREISEWLPPGVSLTSFSYKKGEELKVSGEAGAVGDIYTFKTQLDESKFFVSSALNNVRLDARRGKQMFDVDIKLPGGAL